MAPERAKCKRNFVDVDVEHLMKMRCDRCISQRRYNERQRVGDADAKRIPVKSDCES